MILLTFILYREGVAFFIGNTAYLGYVILIGLAATAALAQKKANGGGLAFQTALRTAFTVFVIALAAQTLFTWLLVNYIDTHFRDALNIATLEKDAQVFKRFGASDEDVTKAIAAQRDRDPYTLYAMSLAFAFVCIVHFIIALLIAAIVKSKKSE